MILSLSSHAIPEANDIRFPDKSSWCRRQGSNLHGLTARGILGWQGRGGESGSSQFVALPVYEEDEEWRTV
jgi:hypothetical protein